MEGFHAKPLFPGSPIREDPTIDATGVQPHLLHWASQVIFGSLASTFVTTPAAQPGVPIYFSMMGAIEPHMSNIRPEAGCRSAGGCRKTLINSASLI